MPDGPAAAPLSPLVIEAGRLINSAATDSALPASSAYAPGSCTTPSPPAVVADSPLLLAGACAVMPSAPPVVPSTLPSGATAPDLLPRAEVGLPVDAAAVRSWVARPAGVLITWSGGVR